MTLKYSIKKYVCRIVTSLYGVELDESQVPVTYPDNIMHGDYATPAAMGLAKTLRKKPLDIAAEIAGKLTEFREFKKIETAGGGFINFFVSDDYLNNEMVLIENNKEYGKNETMKGRKILLEFVSANPTGPLHIGHGRWAAIGASLSEIIKYCGAEVTREFYINDAGSQIKLLRESIEAVKKGAEVPENGYHGSYIHQIAALDGDPVKIIIEMQKKTLSDFHVYFDVYYSELTLHEKKLVAGAIEMLKGTGFTYELEGALWLKTTVYGDDKDRVLIKAGGEYTYFAVDIAYHYNKIERDYNCLINILGADHHGYKNRIESAVKICSEKLNKNIEFHVLIGQLVSLYRDGQPVRMSKRTGEMISLEEVIEEIGADASRYYLVMRKADTPLDFDLETAKKQSDENPVFYVQYAHARIAGILRNAPDMAGIVPGDELIDSPEARDLSITLARYTEIIEDSAAALEPHRLPQYLEELSGVFHRFYNSQRVITDNPAVTANRLIMVRAVRNVIRSGLNLIGVSAPDQM